MKKTIAFLLTLCMAFSAVACTKEETTKKKKTKKTTEEVETEDPDETEKTKKTKDPDEDDPTTTTEEPTTTTTEEPTTTTEEPTTTTSEPATIQGGVLNGSETYNELADKMIESARKNCNAKEADATQYNRIVKETLTPRDTMFADGVYAIISGDDATDLSAWGFETLTNGASTNGTMFCKCEGDTAFLVFVVEMSSENKAVELFQELYGMTGNADEQSIRDMKKGTDLQCGFLYEEDKEVALYINSASKDTCVSMYFRVDGNVVTAGVFNGTASSGICTEYNDFMKDADIVDYYDLVANF